LAGDATSKALPDDRRSHAAGGLLSAAPLPEAHRMIGRSPRLTLISGRTAVFGLFTTRPFPNVSYLE